MYHGQDYGLILLCSNYPRCDAFVGCHRGTEDPKGTMANAELRLWRRRAHAAFDPLWVDGKMERNDAYCYLADLLGIDPDHCHIGMMNIEECRNVYFALEVASILNGVLR